MSRMSRTQTTFAPPVMEARRWLAGEDLHNVVDKKLGYIPGGQ